MQINSHAESYLMSTLSQWTVLCIDFGGANFLSNKFTLKNNAPIINNLKTSIFANGIAVSGIGRLDFVLFYLLESTGYQGIK